MANKVDNAVLGKRIGHSSETGSGREETTTKTEGLELSQIVYRTIDSLKPNPINAVFDSLKTDSQLDALFRDIDEARAILNPLIAMPDGTLVEGHSRLKIAKRLLEEGRGIGSLPVRIITTALTNEEIKQRVYLGNLSRFEIDEDTRILLYAEIWPDYFYLSGKAGRKPDHGDTITASKLSKKLGKSVPQIKRDAAIFRKARKQVGGNPSITDIKESRKELNEERKRREQHNGAKKDKQPKQCSNEFPEFELINNFHIDGIWNFSLEISAFLEYAKLLSNYGLNSQGTIIEYLVERIIAVEQTKIMTDSSGLSDS